MGGCMNGQMDRREGRYFGGSISKETETDR